MGERKEHLKKLSELSEKIMGLATSIQRTEKDMESTWMDQIEKRDLEELKDQMKAVEEALRTLQGEVGHVEAEHCNKNKETH
jgi:hypothetical protein